MINIVKVKESEKGSILIRCSDIAAGKNKLIFPDGTTSVVDSDVLIAWPVKQINYVFYIEIPVTEVCH